MAPAVIVINNHNEQYAHKKFNSSYAHKKFGTRRTNSDKPSEAFANHTTSLPNTTATKDLFRPYALDDKNTQRKRKLDELYDEQQLEQEQLQPQSKRHMSLANAPMESTQAHYYQHQQPQIPTYSFDKQTFSLLLQKQYAVFCLRQQLFNQLPPPATFWSHGLYTNQQFTNFI